jgi:hypothetical protein
MDLENALETATRLRDAMAEEIASARVERHLLRTLDSDGLFARATQRAAFLADVASPRRSSRPPEAMMETLMNPIK